MKITEYPRVVSFDQGDFIIKDGVNGTKIITVSDAADSFLSLIKIPEMHRNIYRGKNLGSLVTPEQKTAISTGTFDDLFIGDYWTIDGKIYRIADMDYWYQCGDTAFIKHHLVMLPDESMYNHVMNETNTTVGGYVGSMMYTEGLNQAKNIIQTAFGDMLLSHREYLTNAVTNGYPSAGAWFDSDVELMNEVMVYGSYIRTPAGNGTINPTRTTISKQQLAVFKLNPKAVNKRVTLWLRDVVSATYFAIVSYSGDAGSYSASNSSGVRPVFPIG